MGHTKVMSPSKKIFIQTELHWFLFVQHGMFHLYMSRLSVCLYAKSNVKIFILQHDSISLNRVTTTTVALFYLYLNIILLILLRNVVYISIWNVFERNMDWLKASSFLIEETIKDCPETSANMIDVTLLQFTILIHFSIR